MYTNCIAESYGENVYISFDVYDNCGSTEYHVTVISLMPFDNLETIEKHVFASQEIAYEKYSDMCENYRALPF